MRGGPDRARLRGGRRRRSSRAPDVVVKLDADVSFDADYFERLLGAVRGRPSLGIASGSALELRGRRVAPRLQRPAHSVWGAARAYRRGCLRARAPAGAADGLGRHRRAQGERARLDDAHAPRPAVPPPPRARASATVAAGARGRRAGARRTSWATASGTWRCARSTTPAREPAALAMLWGYAARRCKRRPVCADPEVRAELRRAQSVRALAARRREAIGAADVVSRVAAARRRPARLHRAAVICCSSGRCATPGRATRTPGSSAATAAATSSRCSPASASSSRTRPAARSLKNLVRNLLLARRLLGSCGRRSC